MSNRESSRKFHFIRLIASGGFGAVWLCKVMHSDGFSRLAAVKLLHTRWTENEEIARRMRDEARLLGWLRHRNIVDVVDLTAIDGRAAVVMEYLEAVDLKGVIAELSEGVELVPARVCLEIMGYAASALDAAYNRPPYPGEKPLRVIHRDIKPSNVMIDESGLVKVLDFGVARAEFEARESHTRELQFGSVDYMPPERLFFEPETPASDVYSLGATIFEVLVFEKLGKAKGRPERHARFLADRMSYMRARLPVPGTVATDVEDLLVACLSFDHDKRPSAAEVVKKARAVSRQLTGASLSEWAEDNVPRLLQVVTAVEQEESPLTDQVLTEDSKIFGATTPEVPPPSESIPQPFSAPPVEPIPVAVVDDDDDEGVRPTVVNNPTLMPDEFEHTTPVSPFGGEIDPELEATRIAGVVEICDDDDFDEEFHPTSLQSGPLTPMTPPPADLDVDEAETVVSAGPPPTAPVAAAPPPPLERAPLRASLPSLEPSMDDWDDVPTRIESLAKMQAEAAPPTVPEPAPLYTSPPPAVDMDAETRVNPEAEPAPLPMSAPAPPPPPPLTATPPPPDDDPDATAILPGGGEETNILPDQTPAPYDPGAPPPPGGPEPRRPTDIGEAPKKSKLPLIAGAFVGFMLLCMGCGGGLFAFRGQLQAQLAGGFEIPELPGDAAVVETPNEADPIAAKDPPDEVAEAVVPDGPVITFHADLDGIKKLKVSCTGASAEGVAVAHVAAEAADKCQVTAYMKDRSRHSAVVTGASTGDYRCFIDGQATCEN